jgi:hypothetical protein
MIVQSTDNTIPLTEHLITVGLGYCCLWAFFTLYKRTGLISIRLGVTPQTIRRYKARFRGGEFVCKGDCQRCMKKAIKNR